MDEDIIRAEALEQAAHQLQASHSADPYLRWGVAHTSAFLREQARVYRIHATERETPRPADELPLRAP
ncbi:MAG: hypothetical protein JWR33_106 [Naasia sp.]|jgi:hypothetical protein|uniref:hypothetical protein n=1 Tax=Naasia sp. TaxID=2546198 RepID=UPI002621918B|nr:hypothetical protein [Naasia sp.]MCU1569365.1 hypothetical protein [Naasia sp.]